MTQLECTHAASDKKPSVTLQERATTREKPFMPSTTVPVSVVLLCQSVKWGLGGSFEPGNDPATMPEKSHT
jgi:hypothetical protein